MVYLKLANCYDSASPTSPPRIHRFSIASFDSLYLRVYLFLSESGSVFGSLETFHWYLLHWLPLVLGIFRRKESTSRHTFALLSPNLVVPYNTEKQGSFFICPRKLCIFVIFFLRSWVTRNSFPLWCHFGKEFAMRMVIW